MKDQESERADGSPGTGKTNLGAARRAHLTAETCVYADPTVMPSLSAISLKDAPPSQSE
ncbi:MAG: hypothetical protein L3K03_07225 [Thermoplasmata archaeon]|nr:hypothetical protein [Thermoplasmata archaeon]